MQVETTIRRNEHFQRVRVHLDRRAEIRDRHDASAAGGFQDIEAGLAVRTTDFGRIRRRVDHYKSRSASGIFSWISGGRDAMSVAHVWRQFAQVSIITVMLFTTSRLPTC